MTLEQLETLLKRAEDVLQDTISFERNSDSKWSLWTKDGPPSVDLYEEPLEACIARLKQWATPPKPDMLQVLVPIATAEFAAAFNAPGTCESATHSRKLSEACREALAPYQQPE